MSVLCARTHRQREAELQINNPCYKAFGHAEDIDYGRHTRELSEDDGHARVSCNAIPCKLG